jgi:hypothetical protein
VSKCVEALERRKECRVLSAEFFEFIGFIEFIVFNLKQFKKPENPSLSVSYFFLIYNLQFTIKY